MENNGVFTSDTVLRVQFVIIAHHQRFLPPISKSVYEGLLWSSRVENWRFFQVVLVLSLWRLVNVGRKHENGHLTTLSVGLLFLDFLLLRLSVDILLPGMVFCPWGSASTCPSFSGYGVGSNSGKTKIPRITDRIRKKSDEDSKVESMGKRIAKPLKQRTRLSKRKFLDILIIVPNSMRNSQSSQCR